jgi:glutamyl-tRNA synthetase
MARGFDSTRLQRASAHFDVAQLRHWQSEWVHSLSAGEAHAWLAPLLPAGITAAQARAFIAAVLPNVVVADDVRQWCSVVFEDTLSFEEAALQAVRAAGVDFFAAAAHAFEAGPAAGEGPAGEDANVTARAALAALERATGRKGAAFFVPLRAALTGRLHGPQLAPLLAAMPSERARARLLRFARAA